MKELLEKLDGIDLNPALDRWTEEHWGPRCPDYEPLCACCVAWRIRDTTGARPRYVQVIEELDKLQPRSVK
jgi:hypothetical protein